MPFNVLLQLGDEPTPVSAIPFLRFAQGEHLSDSLAGVVDINHRDQSRFASLASDVWGSLVPPTLVARVAGEFAQSDPLFGVEPETTSPLGGIDWAQLGAFNSDDTLSRSMYPIDDQAGAPNLSLSFDALQLEGAPLPMLRATSPTQGVVGAIVLSRYAFAAPLVQGADAINVTYRADTAQERADRRLIRSALKEQVPDAAVVPYMLWRLYLGSNTRLVEGITRGWSIKIPLSRAGNRGGLLVAQLVMGAHKVLDPRTADPTQSRRLLSHHKSHGPVVKQCPDISTFDGRTEAAAIIVHGTMASAIPLAGAVRGKLPPHVQVLRFEHDTWRPVKDNAEELSAHVKRLKLQRLLLVCHSRGGLVARTALDELPGVAVRTVALGTPFAGTPLVKAARIGLIGMRSILGVLRTVGPTFDVATRVSGLLLKTRLPDGLEAMSERSGYITGYVGRPLEGFRVAAAAYDSSGQVDGFGIAFMKGFATGTFEGKPNDLVVSTDSATCRAERPLLISGDHFSYAQSLEVLDLIETAWHDVASGRVFPVTYPTSVPDGSFDDSVSW